LQVVTGDSETVAIEEATTTRKSGFTHQADSASTFEIFTKEAAPEGSRGGALKRLEQSVGAIPNLAATMAGSPALIQCFVNLREINAKESGLSGQEKELLFLTNAVANGCSYCQAVHSMFAAKAGLPHATCIP
jgi:AhpD family alkylhydroperoxidase